jgi:hypothetical protein
VSFRRFFEPDRPEMTTVTAGKGNPWLGAAPLPLVGRRVRVPTCASEDRSW